MHDLKPCPFCGGKPEIDPVRVYRNTTTGNMETEIVVYCTVCSAEMSRCSKDVPDLQPKHVADLWNNRYLQPNKQTNLLPGHTKPTEPHYHIEMKKGSC